MEFSDDLGPGPSTGGAIPEYGNNSEPINMGEEDMDLEDSNSDVEEYERDSTPESLYEVHDEEEEEQEEEEKEEDTGDREEDVVILEKDSRNEKRAVSSCPGTMVDEDVIWLEQPPAKKIRLETGAPSTSRQAEQSIAPARKTKARSPTPPPMFIKDENGQEVPNTARYFYEGCGWVHFSHPTRTRHHALRRQKDQEDRAKNFTIVIPPSTGRRPDRSRSRSKSRSPSPNYKIRNDYLTHQLQLERKLYKSQPPVRRNRGQDAARSSQPSTSRSYY